MADDVPWWPHRPARAGAPTDPVTEERIVETALELLRGDDTGDVSIRRIATALGVSRATVYWWVGSRGRLIALVSEAIHGRIPLPEPDDARPWDEQLRALIEATYDAYAAYPGAHSLLNQGTLAGPMTLHVLDRYLSLLLDAGFGPDEAAQAWRSIVYVLFGALAETAPTRRDETTWTAGQGLGSLPADAYPGLARTADALEQPGVSSFDFALDTLFRGLTARVTA